MAVCATPTAPRFEHLTDPGTELGVGTPAPRLSWTVPSADADWRQGAYEVEVTRGGATQTYRVEGAEQVLVPWPAEPLTSRERVSVRVRVAHGGGQDGGGPDEEWSGWSPERSLEAGLLSPQDWSARFVSPVGIGGMQQAAPVVRGRITVPGTVASARLYATALGAYVATLNGTAVSDAVLAPGWTSYEHRLRYHAYDVTALVTAGENDLEFLLGNGWYRGRMGFIPKRGVYGDRLAVLAQLEVTTTDGAVHVLASDGSWTAHESEVLADDLYDGQRTDLRRRGQVIGQGPVEVLEENLERLVAAEQPVVRPVQELPARKVWTTKGFGSSTIVDFGQNAVGWVRLRVRGLPAGTEVVVRHAEVLDGERLALEPLRTAAATSSYLLAGPAEEVLEPCLTLHGFRYASITGVPDLRPEDVELVVVGTDLERTGWFSSSHDLLDRFHENVVWSTRGNFVEVPTDCPQRDERLGWTGDIQVFGPTATFLFDTVGFLGNWLTDLAAEQLPDGSVPHIVPDVTRVENGFQPAAAWGDAATIVPWTLYERSGDRAVLERQFESMRGWVDRVTGLAGPDRLWSGDFQFGDWLDPTAPPEDSFRAKADSDVVATGHFARSTELLARTARVLGYQEAAATYGELASEIRAAFADAYVTAAGRVHSDAQAVYALAIVWDLLPTAQQREFAGRWLADLVRSNDFRVGTGFVGTPLVCEALAMTGHADVAHRLLLQTACPSWLYPVTMGATTIWERWDSMRPDGSINSSGMTSFNHYALGAVADWLHRSVAGLAPAAPGYAQIEVRPLVPAGLTHAAARHRTPYGEASVAWTRAQGTFRLDVTVPVGATAHVHVPGHAEPVSVGHGQHHFEAPDPVVAPQRDWSTATIRDLVDDEETWNRLVARAVELEVVGGSAHAAAKVARFLDSPMSRLAAAFVDDERFPGGLAIRRVVAQLVAGEEF